ncbi:MAG: hypothetical protein U0Q22_02515 [Acidimicrobiales bacterium]
MTGKTTGTHRSIEDHPAGGPRLPLPTLFGLRLKHAGRLAREVASLSAAQGTWWLLPAVLVVVVITVLASATSATVPYLVYALF